MDNSLYSIFISDNQDQEPIIKKINHQFNNQITAISTPPQSWFSNQLKSPYQLVLGQNDLIETPLLVATDDGNILQFTAMVGQQSLTIKQVNSLNLKKHITSIDEVHQILLFQWNNFDPSTILLATETGYIVSLYASIAGNNVNIAFKHIVCQLSNINTFVLWNEKTIIVSQKNSLLFYNINKQNSQPENVIIIQDNNDIIGIACSYTTYSCITSQTFRTYNQLGQLIQQQSSPEFDGFTYLYTNQNRNCFFVGTANGVFQCYKQNGILENMSVVQPNLGASLAMQSIGSIITVLCYGGLCKLLKIPKQVNIGQIQVSVLDGTKLLINDKKNQLSDVYLCNEYITGIFSNMWSKQTTICITTQTRVLVFTQYGNTNDWIQRPVCTQQMIQGQTTAGQRQSVSSVLKYSPLGAKASNRFVVITDSSGSIKILSKEAMNILHELKINCTNINQIVLTDEIIGIINQNRLSLININTGLPICRPFIHNKKILKCAISCGQIIKQEQDQTQQNNQQSINVNLNGVFGFGANSQINQQQQNQQNKSKPYIAIIDSNDQCLVSQITKFEANQQISFQPIGISEKILDISYAQNSQILTLLIQNSIQLPSPQTVYFNLENINTNNSLRIIQVANPLQYDSQIFYTQESVNLSRLQKAISLIGSTEANSLSLSIQQMLQQSINAEITTILQSDDNVVYAEVNIYDCLSVKLPLFQFPLLLEQNSDNPQLLKRICLFVNSKSLWQQCYYIAKQIDDQDLIQQSLVHSNNVAVALVSNENDKPIDELIGLGQYQQAIIELCQEWKFEEALQVAQKGQGLESLVIQLRRDAFKDLGGIADERDQLWQDAVKRCNMQ